MSDILQKIIEQKKIEVTAAKSAVSQDELQSQIATMLPPRDFRAALAIEGIRVIAELKRRSPSKGLIRENFPVETLATELEGAGAAALSVLTERHFFDGSPQNLQRVRPVVNIPLLRKDFIFDEYQVYEARAWGADAILLIAAVLEKKRFIELQSLAHSLGLAVLAEAHTASEVEMLVSAQAQIIGINARNLNTFETSLELSAELIAQVPTHCLAVAESAIRTSADIAALRAAGAQAFLIGETLMRSESPGLALKNLLGAE